jgi:hypothetical protein
VASDDDGLLPDPDDDDGSDLPWWQITFWVVLCLSLVAGTIYLYVLATGH